MSPCTSTPEPQLGCLPGPLLTQTIIKNFRQRWRHQGLLREPSDSIPSPLSLDSYCLPFQEPQMGGQNQLIALFWLTWTSSAASSIHPLFGFLMRCLGNLVWPTRLAGKNNPEKKVLLTQPKVLQYYGINLSPSFSDPLNNPMMVSG